VTDEKKMKVEKTEENNVGNDKKPSWIKMKPAEVEKLVVNLANRGKSPAQIGLVLRDKHGIPRSKVFGRRISEILEEKGVEYRGEKVMVSEHVERLKKHIEKNKQDHPASRALSKRLWVVHKLK
jgi:small subunit ribosomal protein S15